MHFFQAVDYASQLHKKSRTDKQFIKHLEHLEQEIIKIEQCSYLKKCTPWERDQHRQYTLARLNHALESCAVVQDKLKHHQANPSVLNNLNAVARRNQHMLRALTLQLKHIDRAITVINTKESDHTKHPQGIELQPLAQKHNTMAVTTT